MQDDVIAMEDQTMTIPKDHFVCGCNLDDEVPYCTITPKDEFAVEHEKKVLIPKALAYFLRTHFCGSYEMHKLITDHAKFEAREKIKEALGL